jgi:hypothetical protein
MVDDKFPIFVAVYLNTVESVFLLVKPRKCMTFGRCDRIVGPFHQICLLWKAFNSVICHFILVSFEFKSTSARFVKVYRIPFIYYYTLKNDSDIDVFALVCNRL